ncbi:RNA helicase Mov10l1 [Pleuronectes platessa]|uniref:RNA helicase Mov10l1 n=1 Tax=Pleuronectes platessa TaxID=8262 RepID=UPI00232A18AB|nr:RNA helicase Mov10l1 [Pleuronectes platessa]
MLTALRCVLSKLVSPLWRTEKVDGEDSFPCAPGTEDVRHLRGGVVTQLFLDHGMIDGAVYFTSGQVLGGMPLKEGDLVNCIAVRDGAQGGWKAVRVEKSADAWEDGGRTSLEADSMHLRPLIGTVTSFDRDGGYINQTTYFPRNSLWEGYEPMKGDWVQAKYFVNPTQWTTQAHSVVPLRYCRLDQVRVTSVFGNNGVVEDKVFFSLDSLLLPAQYRPVLGHLVNLVMVESNQSIYSWRALCMAPCLQSVSLPAAILPDTELQSLLENKGGLNVTEYGQFGDLSIGDRRELVLWIQSLGSCAELLLLHFSSFTIGRRLDVTVGSEEENLLQPSLPYAPSDTCSLPAVSSQVITVCAAKGPPRLTNRRLPNFLGSFPAPRALRDCVEAQRDVLVVEPSLGEVLSPSNMYSRFSALLWLEELHAEREVGEFSIIGAILRKGAVHLHLEVLGLAEGRPSLNIGDRIVLKKPRSDGAVMEYLSFVTEINDEDVSLRVNSEFQRSYLGEPLDVEFSYNRTTSRRCHNALLQTKQFGGILFPSRVTPQTPQWTGKWMEDNEAPRPKNSNVSRVSMDMKSKATQTKSGGLLSKPIPSKGHLFNPELNPPQRKAVKSILEGECRPIPYVLFGPPGTGKTITLIESILQVYHFIPSSRVLVCTPSNSAADLICVRLLESGFLHAASLARVNASCRQDESIPEVLRLYSRAGEDIRQASFHRIVVSTCSSAGMFHSIGLQVGHFTHLFLDEAGQATEPESLIPMSLVSERDGQIVLAGDPRQLGPIVKSKLAAAFGLGVSLLERLMSNPLYTRQDWGYNPKLVTKLIYNYRSHEALLTLPSKLFYKGELCCEASRAVVESLCQWKTLPKKGFPLLFHGVRGTEMREGKNPSWFNPVEAVQVMLYCCQLAKKLYNPVGASDIGIIAPYKKQCEKIRVLLGKVGLSDIKVGSVEEFQGQEFLVIIMSTVRSNESVPSDDLQNSLGFLANPKRFNVAVTRPKALLLIVGNPHILIRDLCFRALLQYCFINGAYLGCDPPPSLRDSQICLQVLGASCLHTSVWLRLPTGPGDWMWQLSATDSLHGDCQSYWSPAGCRGGFGYG